eukprot:CAMPEP_0172199550 /NCGR_PEP_ID=MMETSP1050-20130122/28759_1 /TAXON_ID=233186 /ORGANISM="Cryptomonas curvata, Strain CCAP979/52" /LENGTH=78 /DNA_ID=CAMNT_0012876603 /DNA_START=262 /DNA_END=495 /DNA_ORIENTATION=+
MTRTIDSFEIVDQAIDEIDGPNTKVVVGTAASLDPAAHVLKLLDGREIPYDKICISTGASPHAIARHPRVLCLRDSDS